MTVLCISSTDLANSVILKAFTKSGSSQGKLATKEGGIIMEAKTCAKLTQYSCENVQR